MNILFDFWSGIKGPMLPFLPKKIAEKFDEIFQKTSFLFFYFITLGSNTYLHRVIKIVAKRYWNTQRKSSKLGLLYLITPMPVSGINQNIITNSRFFPIVFYIKKRLTLMEFGKGDMDGK
ncbi:MAG: hypothetical protein JSW60_02990 [Thermoplasmatales archaeon]|nr:MAG: hypothetical protein JSW60_02990 [Thermoplasmatales archaeon]